MKVYVRGVEFTCSDAVSVAELFDFLSAKPIYEKIFRDHKVTLIVESLPDYWVGLMVTNKNVKGTAVITNTGGKYVLNVRTPQPGDSPIEFNFFAIKKTCQRGVMTSYSGSGGPSNFGCFLDGYYQFIMNEAKNLELIEIKSETNEKKRKKLEKLINKKYRLRRFKATALVSKETFKQLLNSVKEFNTIEVIKKPNSGAWYGNVMSNVSKDSSKIHVKKGAPVVKMRQFVGTVINNETELTDIAIHGKTATQSISFAYYRNRIAGLEELDYNEVLIDKNLTFEKICDTPIIDTLMSVVLDNDDRFPG